MPVMSASRFERFFRTAAGLDVDKADVKRYTDFVNRKLRDLLAVAVAGAEANGRDVVQPRDLPITSGLQRSIHEFQRLDEDIELQPILDQLATLPPLDLSLAGETQARLPAVAGGLSVALARSFRLIDPNVRNPQTWQWERAFQLFDLLV